MIKVQNMKNANGNSVANQFVIIGDGKCRFQSYNSLVAEWDYNTQSLTLGRDWDYSNTTMKHLNSWMKEYTGVPFDHTGAANIRKAIAAGLIKYDPEMR